MALKVRFKGDERYGLTEEEILAGEKYLRKHKTAGIIAEADAMGLYEMFMVGCSFFDINQKHPQYPIGQLVLTAARARWPADRDKVMGSLKDRVQASVTRSMLEQVDFLTSMLSVANAEHMRQMMDYIQDPVSNTKPDMRIQNIKEYKDIVETLQKIVNGSQSQKQNPAAMISAIATPTKKAGRPKKVISAAANLIDAELTDE